MPKRRYIRNETFRPNSVVREFAEADPVQRYNAMKRAKTSLSVLERVELEDIQTNMKKALEEKRGQTVNIGPDSMNELCALLGLWLVEHGYGK